MNTTCARCGGTAGTPVRIPNAVGTGLVECQDVHHAPPWKFVAITDAGRSRIPDTPAGTEFEVHCWTAGREPRTWIAHVRDWRRAGMYKPYAIWTLGNGDWSRPVENLT